METDTTGPEKTGTGPTLKGFLLYSGNRDEAFGLQEGTPTFIVDGIFLCLNLVMIYRNLILKPHPAAWVIVAITAVQIYLLIARPARLTHWRVALFAAGALAVAMLMPVRMGENIMVGAFIGNLGLLALFFIYGTLISIAASLSYLLYMGFVLHYTQYTFADPMFINIMLVGFMMVSVGTLSMLHHFMVRLDTTNDSLRMTTEALQQTLESLQFSASAGGVALWDYDRTSDRLQVNQAFREITGLDHESFPILDSTHIERCLPASSRPNILQRIRGDQDQDVELIEISRTDGTVILCEGMSKFYPLSGERGLRRGMLVAVSEPEPVLSQENTK